MEVLKVSKNEARTQLELATSWGRAFNQLFTEFKWLNAFARLNVIAAKKSIQRMQKNLLEVKDNVIEKLLLVKLKEYGYRFFTA